MPFSFVSTLPQITVMLYPVVSVPVVFDTGSGVNLMSLLLLRWLQLVAPSAIVRVYDCNDDIFPFVPIHVCGVIKDDLTDPSYIPGRLTKVAVLHTCHIITAWTAFLPYCCSLLVSNQMCLSMRASESPPFVLCVCCSTLLPSLSI